MSATSDHTATRPSDRDEVTNALVSATERLCALGQPSSFTVADIAREANTTTSLLYFYFESKDDLVLATLRSIASDLDSQGAEVTTPSEVAVAVSRSLIERPAFARTLSWLVLERRSIPQEMGDNPFLRRLMTTLATDETEDPHT